MPSIIIVGAGIGGLTLANALRQRGLNDVRVLERAEAVSPVGAGIWLPPNAMQIMQRLGLAEALEAAGLPLDAVELRRPWGRLIGGVKMDAVRERFGQTTVSILRARLHEVLLAALPEGTLQLGKGCTAVHDDGRGVRITCADGSEERAEIVVGADGLRSAVREALVPGVVPRSAKQACFRGLANYTLPRQNVCCELWGGTHRIGYSAVSADEVYWFACMPEKHRPSTEGDALRAELLRRFADFPDEVREMLTHTPPEAIIETPLADLDPRHMPRWHAGRVVLLGDAAHATTPNLGQGGAQAIEDAWSLAHELAASPEEPQAAFARYEASRRAKAHFVVHQSWQLGKLAHLRSRPLQAAFDLVTRLMQGRSGRRLIERLYTVAE